LLARIGESGVIRKRTANFFGHSILGNMKRPYLKSIQQNGKKEHKAFEYISPCTD
jgi:hypothetical protein